VVALFQGHAYLEAQARAAALAALQPLSALFPAAPQLLSLVARALYGLHRFDAAQALLGTLRARDPHRLEDADTLSNILFVRGDRAALATQGR
jgi:predicted Zn-dependent protease